MLDIDDDWDSDGVSGVEVDKRFMNRRLQRLQKSCCAKQRSVLAIMLDVFTLATEIVKEPVAGASDAMESDAAIGNVTMGDALKRVGEYAENAKAVLAGIAQAQKKMEETHTKKVLGILLSSISNVYLYTRSDLNGPTTHC